MDDEVTVRFRVGAVYKNSAVTMYFGDQEVLRRKKQIMAPGEMEEVKISKSKLAEYGDIDDITIKIESA